MRKFKANKMFRKAFADFWASLRAATARTRHLVTVDTSTGELILIVVEYKIVNGEFIILSNHMTNLVEVENGTNQSES